MARGRVLYGTDELERFWGSRQVVMPTLRMFHGRGDDVLVEAEYERDRERVGTVWLLYRFNGATLVEAIAFPNEAQPRADTPPSASGDAAERRNMRAAAEAALSDISVGHQVSQCAAAALVVA